MGSELVRADEQTRGIATEGLKQFIESVANSYEGLKPRAARARAMLTVSAMVGALTLSRVVTDPELSDALLRQSRKQLLDGASPPSG